LCPKSIILEGSIYSLREKIPFEKIGTLIQNGSLGKCISECPDEIDQESQDPEN
jgi:hypothetical protein